GDGLPTERLERPRDAALPHVLGNLAKRELAGRREPLAPGEGGEGDLPALVGVDLACTETILERLGGQVDEDDLVRLVEDAVRKGLADTRLGELEDRVVPARLVVYDGCRDLRDE